MNAVTFAIAVMQRLAGDYDMAPIEAAQHFKRSHATLALDVMERIGCWPASDPWLRALQQVWA